MHNLIFQALKESEDLQNSQESQLDLQVDLTVPNLEIKKGF